MANGYEPTVYYYNPNIFPEKEYLIRKNEITEYAKKLGVPIIDGDWNHDFWREKVKGLEDEPERGARCLQCFRVRLYQTAKIASEMGFSRFPQAAGSVLIRWRRPGTGPHPSSPELNTGTATGEKAVCRIAGAP